MQEGTLMNSRERVYTAANHKEPDRVPICFGGAAGNFITECPPDGNVFSQLCTLCLIQNRRDLLYVEQRTKASCHVAVDRGNILNERTYARNISTSAQFGGEFLAMQKSPELSPSLLIRAKDSRYHPFNV